MSDSSLYLQHTVSRLAETSVPEESRGEIAEYITMLASNNKTPQEIVDDLSSLLPDTISLDFVNSLFNDYQSLKNSADNGTVASVTSTESSSVNDVSSNGTFTSSGNVSLPLPTNPFVFDAASATQFTPRGTNSNSKHASGVRKAGNNFRGNHNNTKFNMKNPKQLQKVLSSLLSGQSVAPKEKKKIRCTKFPHCTYGKDCMYIHPTKICFQYPNCPNPKGTCTYLHPGEDDALIAEFEKVKTEAEQKKLETMAKVENDQNGIAVCNKGAECTFRHCKFAHPTPSNEKNEINDFQWCEAGTNCTNVSCHKAHPSYKKFDPTAQLAKMLNIQKDEKSLEQCKFGSRCLNPRCKYRHASTPVICRDGANCTRPDCYFSHPLDQDCKYSINCKNKKCLFKHPPERDALINKPLVWSASTANNNDDDETNASSTMQRKFAVDEDKILESGIPQEDTSMTA